ncbi:alpha/beta hydrolase [Polaromonas sp. A23]|uniref:alpha/beta hydrolase n=1 Tax=Polaromonas sp. A23 TaxID=1944133 RepID=UPI0009847F0C|nr:alpha/beta fold hydrolase [Polaromonas sp. A23]OOG47652.1 phospholipase [Polaromonas sp. A23]
MLDLPLSFLHRPADAASAAPWLLVLMHGVGSNEEDLFGLAPYVPAQFHVVSLRAPYVMGPSAYGWFEFAVNRVGDRIINEPQEAASRATVAKTVTFAAQQLGIPPERVVVGGFSQGGIMSLSLLLTQPALLKGAMVMHSRLLTQVVPLVAAPEALTGKQLWVSHGMHDQVIPLVSAHAIRALVETLPIELSYSEYPSAHELIQQELVEAMGWLQRLAA